MSVYTNQDIFARVNSDIIFCPNKGMDQEQDNEMISNLIVGVKDPSIKSILLKYGLMKLWRITSKPSMQLPIKKGISTTP